MANHLPGCKCKDERYGAALVQPVYCYNLCERMWCRLECAINVNYVTLGQYFQLLSEYKQQQKSKRVAFTQKKFNFYIKYLRVIREM